MENSLQMKIAFFGYGKMNRLIEQMAHQKGHTTAVIISEKSKPMQSDDFSRLAVADVAIDFSHSSAVLEHLEACLTLQKPLVIGTTGWENHYTKAEEAVKQKQGSCFFSPNFSIGMCLFQEIISYAIPMLQSLSDYLIEGHEQHHAHKKDSPSGTAKNLTELIRMHHPHFGGFTSERLGNTPGIHTIKWISEADQLIFTHEAQNRNGFALGALQAAQWVLGRKGFFTMKNMIEDVWNSKGSTQH